MAYRAIEYGTPGEVLRRARTWRKHPRDRAHHTIADAVQYAYDEIVSEWTTEASAYGPDDEHRTLGSIHLVRR